MKSDTIHLSLKTSDTNMFSDFGRNLPAARLSSVDHAQEPLLRKKHDDMPGAGACNEGARCVQRTMKPMMRLAAIDG